MTGSQLKRMWIVVIGLGFASMIIIGRLVAFQVVQGAHWKELGKQVQRINVVAKPDRGIIYDRNGAVLAGNSADYQIGVSPALITQAEELATHPEVVQLARRGVKGGDLAGGLVS